MGVGIPSVQIRFAQSALVSKSQFYRHSIAVIRLMPGFNRPGHCVVLSPASYCLSILSWHRLAGNAPIHCNLPTRRLINEKGSHGPFDRNIIYQIDELFNVMICVSHAQGFVAVLRKVTEASNMRTLKRDRGEVTSGSTEMKYPLE
jgi:hypothetical protein